MERTIERLTRIEERLIHIEGRSDERHEALLGVLKPVVVKVDKHHDDIVKFKRDHKWLVMLAGAIGAAAGHLMKYLPHQ